MSWLSHWMHKTVEKKIPPVPDDVAEARAIRTEAIKGIEEIREQAPAIMAPIRRIVGRAQDNGFGQEVTLSFTRRIPS